MFEAEKKIRAHLGSNDGLVEQTLAERFASRGVSEAIKAGELTEINERRVHALVGILETYSGHAVRLD